MTLRLSPEVQQYILAQNKQSFHTFGLLDELHSRICDAYLELGNRFSWYDSRQERPKESAHNRIHSIMSTEERVRKLWATMPINVLFSKLLVELRLQLTKMEDELKVRDTSQKTRTVDWEVHEKLKQVSRAQLEEVRAELKTRTSERQVARARADALEEELATLSAKHEEMTNGFAEELLVERENAQDQHRQFAQLLQHKTESDQRDKQVMLDGVDAIQDVILREHERLQSTVTPHVTQSKTEMARLKEDLSILQAQRSFLRKENSLLKHQVKEAKIGYDSYRTDPRLLKAKNLEQLLRKAKERSATKDLRIKELDKTVQKLEFHTRTKTEQLEEANTYIEQHNVSMIHDPQVLLSLHNKLAASLSSDLQLSLLPNKQLTSLTHSHKSIPQPATKDGGDKQQLLDDTSGFVSKYRRMKLARKISTSSSLSASDALPAEQLKKEHNTHKKVPQLL